MAWWRPAAQLVELTVDEIRPTPIDHSKSTVGDLLDIHRGNAVVLEKEIAEKTERLRQTRVSIDALSEADRMLSECADPSGGGLPIPAKIGRLVPRTVKGGRT